jgi:hypothetical protein
MTFLRLLEELPDLAPLEIADAIGITKAISLTARAGAHERSDEQGTCLGDFGFPDFLPRHEGSR